jgi:hypothetical protein
MKISEPICGKQKSMAASPLVRARATEHARWDNLSPVCLSLAPSCSRRPAAVTQSVSRRVHNFVPYTWPQVSET